MEYALRNNYGLTLDFNFTTREPIVHSCEYRCVIGVYTKNEYPGLENTRIAGVGIDDDLHLSIVGGGDPDGPQQYESNRISREFIKLIREELSDKV